MSQHGCRNDFISDNSSSDEESLPDMGSLRDRLARKRQLISMNSGSSDRNHIPISKSNHNADIESVDDDCNSCRATSSVQSNTDNFSENISDTKEQSVHENSLKGQNSDEALTLSKPSVPKVKKRSADEIEDRKRLAQEKKVQREKEKQAKEAEKEMRKVERESKKQFSLGSCLKYIHVIIDTHVVNTCGLGAVILKACEELGVVCETKELMVPFTVMWKRQVTECKMSSDMKVQTTHGSVEEEELIVIVPVNDFVQMVNTYKMKQRGQLSEGMTYRDYVVQIKSCLPDKTITLIVPGLEQYFRDLKSNTQRKYKQAVQGNTNNTRKTNKEKSGMVSVSRVDIEEVVTDTLLQTGYTTFMIEKPEEVADLIRRFSKAVAERPAKKDRFDPIFSFHEEGVGGVKVDKNGNGLLKVWKQQLLQFKNCSPDVSQAIIAEFPSPLLLRKAYHRCSSEKEAIKLLENIVVRRGAGVLETTRRVGKELSRRIFLFFTSEDPDLVIK